MRKPYQLPGWTKNSSYYNAPVGDRTHDLPSAKVSHALNHSAMDRLCIYVLIFMCWIQCCEQFVGGLASANMQMLAPFSRVVDSNQ